MKSFSYVLRLLPGVLLCALITGAATILQKIETHFAGQPYLEALVLAILLGVVIRAVWKPAHGFEAGIVFSAKFLLEFSVMLLGASVSVRTVLGIGPYLLIGIAFVVTVALVSSYIISRGLGLSKKMAILIACGNSICGNSAIAAVAPVIGAKSEDITSSIAFTAVLGVVMVIGLPFLVPILGLSLTQYGVLAGLTVYAVPQVLAATLPIGALSNQVGTVIKLVRVLMLGPVVLVVSLLTSGSREKTDESVHSSAAAARPKSRRVALRQLVPWFIVAFLLVATARSLGWIPERAVGLTAVLANRLTTVSMAALGLGVDLRVVAKAGIKVTLAVILSLIVLGIISMALIWTLGVA